MKSLLSCNLILLLILLLETSEVEIGFRFEEVGQSAGIDQMTVSGGEKTNRYLLEGTGCGAAFFDYNNDGWLDIFLVNGTRLEGFKKGSEPTSHLYRSNRNGTFADVTREATVGRTGWGQAVCVGDYDNDGFEDFFVTYWGQNILYRNQGDGSFQDITQKAGLLQDRKRWNSGCAFLDYDRDGDLDLFVANYIDHALETTPTPDSGRCQYQAMSVACGPTGLKGGKNILYRNQGNGTFADVSDASGVTRVDGTYGLGVLTADFNNDGWVDVYVANDSSPSTLYRNKKDGTFTDTGVWAGVAYSRNGKAQAGMGVSAGDFNHDGTLDIFKTNFSEDTANLYRNLGDGFFEEAAFATGIAVNTQFLGWGCQFVDFDNDSWLDIFQVNGHVYPEMDQPSSGSRYKQRKIVYLNLGKGKFRDVTEQIGGAILEPKAGRGAAFGDYDNDGDVDVLVNNVNDRPNLYQTVSSDDNHWISIRPRGVKSNRSGIGARVRCKVGSLELIDEVRSGGSYYSQSQQRVHFGLGQAKQVDVLEVHWPSGQVDRFENIPGDQFLYVKEGVGIKGRE